MKSENGSKKFRIVEINQSQPKKYTSNSIVTTKYNFITFLPLFLIDQFSNYGNIFFLIISILQQLPDVSPMGRYITVIPLTIILTVSGIKELYEDIIRRREDNKINARQVELWTTSGWSTVQWKQVKGGEIVRVKNNFEFPADLVMVCSSDKSTGIAYVETVNLDGENNLKIRRVPNSLNTDEEELNSLLGTIKCDQPNELIYSFNGMIVLPSGEKISINEEQLLLREAILRNTDWVIGIVVYTGIDTKIWRNSHQRELKRSNSADMINWHMMVLFTVFFLLTVCNSILYIVYNYRVQEDTWYLPVGRTSASTIGTFLTFAIGYSYIIPISLQIYLEIVRLIQANYINRDEKLYHQSTQTYAKARSSNLNSDLGQVKYIFTDKTGTLTQNILEFRECSINGHVYSGNNIGALINLTEKNSIYHHFFIAICVVPGVIPIFNKTTDEWKYYSSSTDQLALITAAKKFGYELRQRTYRDAEVSVKGTILKYKILSDIDFTNERRRTSVIVKTPDNKIVLYVIGADDVIYQRLATQANTLELRNKTSEHIVTFALSGLRTMCLAMAELYDTDFRRWQRSYVRARLSLASRQLQISKLAEQIEKDLSLLGAVACEDKLQEDVPETISTLIAAGIKVWMLTGDKQETAINIGYSTKLLSSESTMFVLDSDNIVELQNKCVQISQEMSHVQKPVLVVNGQSLTALLKSNYAEYFITLSMNCESVICCRMIPIEKARIVNYVQNRTNRVTLAIGDGANDVAMIQAASVGVGISGVEGLQAVFAADYSIAVFKHLIPLLLIHGTWNYDRVCKIIYFIYYKNIPICLTLFYMSYASGWSGCPLFDDWAFMLYNVAFTDGATLAIGVLEKNYPENVLLSDPAIYQRNNWFDITSFYVCLLNGALHSVLILILTLNICDRTTLWESSYSDSYMVQGNILYTNLLIVVTAKCFLHIMNWKPQSLFFVLFTALLWFPVLFIFNYLWKELRLNPDLAGITTMLFSTPIFWLNLILVPFSVLLIDLVVITLYRTFSVSENHNR